MGEGLLEGFEGSVVLDKVVNGSGAFGFNAATEKYEDLEKAGVIDPTKVVRTALENIAVGGYAEAVVRMMILMARARGAALFALHTRGTRQGRG